jgi:TRAP-type C4-dicarboxylate transport system substrate-binding protein
MITSPTTGVNSRGWDYLTHFNDIQAWIPKNMVIVNQRAFDALDDATKQAVLDAAKAAEARGWATSMAEGEAMKEELAANGIEVQAPSEAFQVELQAIGDTMIEEWQGETGDAGNAIIGQYRGG